MERGGELHGGEAIPIHGPWRRRGVRREGVALFGVGEAIRNSDLGFTVKLKRKIGPDYTRP